MTKTKVKARDPEADKPRAHPAQIFAWIVGGLASIVTGGWVLFLYVNTQPAKPVLPGPTPDTPKPAVIQEPVLTLNNWFVGGWDATISNSNDTPFTITTGLLISPFVSFSTSMTVKILLPKFSTPLQVRAFDESPQGRSNFEAAKRDLLHAPQNTRCAVEVEVQDVNGVAHKPRAEFDCSRIVFPLK